MAAQPDLWPGMSRSTARGSAADHPGWSRGAQASLRGSPPMSSRHSLWRTPGALPASRRTRRRTRRCRHGCRSAAPVPARETCIWGCPGRRQARWRLCEPRWQRPCRRADTAVATVAHTAATEPGVVLGTPRYMSPEQAQAQPIDTRADIFSFGAVFYEMLAGRPAFARENAATTLVAILGETPAPLETIRGDLPPNLAPLIDSCLAKDRAERPSAQDIVTRLGTICEARRQPTPVAIGALLGRPAVLVPIVLILVSAVTVGAWWWTKNARVRWAQRVALPDIQRLAEHDDYDGAYRLAREALTVLPDDPQLKQQWFNITFLTTIESTPAGADVAVKGYEATGASWIPLGRTPLENVRVPFGQVRVRVLKDGFAPIEATQAGLRFNYTLGPPASIPPGMVRVQGRTANIDAASVRVGDFWMDRFEVTNREFKTFVDRGGYRTREFWTEPLVANGRTLPWEEAIAVFRDTTGRPGPATWELGTYQEGQADLPVTGVSWYEAAAYAAFAGKR